MSTEPQTAEEVADPPEHAVELVVTALRRARDEGGGAGWAELQEQTGLGGGDLTAAVTQLRDRGQAVEDAPGSFRWRDADDMEEELEPASPSPLSPVIAGEWAATETQALRVRLAELGVSEEEMDAALPGVVEAGRVARSAQAAAGGRPVVIRLPVAVATDMEAAALGDMVAKGVAQADTDGVPFRLEVE